MKRTFFAALLCVLVASLPGCGKGTVNGEGVEVVLRWPASLAQSPKRRAAVWARQRQWRVRVLDGKTALDEQRLPAASGTAPALVRMAPWDSLPKRVRVEVAVLDDRALQGGVVPLEGGVTVEREALRGRTSPLVVPLRLLVPVSYWD